MTKRQIIAELRRLGIAHRAKAPKDDLERLLATAQKPKSGMIPAKRDFKPFRDGTKQAELYRLMSRKNGATLDELCAATGWSKGAVKSAFYLDLAKMHGVGVRTEGGRHHAVVGHE